MARRRRKNDELAMLAQLPWQISIGFGFVVFALMRWVVPTLLSGNQFLVGFASLSRSLAWLALIVFGVSALVAFARAQKVNLGSNGASPTRPTPGAKLSTGPIPGFGQSAVSRNASSDVTIPGFGNSSHAAQEFDEWTLDALRQLEWKRFELLCAGYYEAVGFRTQTFRCGADGGIDVKLFKGEGIEPLAIIQCKAWNSKQVPVQEIRELLGVMAHEKVRRGIFITTSTYTADALAFGTANPMLLLDGDGFIAKLRALPKERQDELLRTAFAGDYKTPTCPSCGIKTVRRESKRSAFWGCPNYPRCKTLFNGLGV